MLTTKSATLSKQMLINFYGKTGLRGFATITPDCQEQLKKLGIKNKNIVFNPTYTIILLITFTFQ